SFLIAAAYGAGRFSLFYQRGTLPSTPEFGDLPTRALLAAKSLALYGSRLLFPVNLTVEYPDPNRAAAWGRYLLAGIPLAAAAGLGAWRTGGEKARFGLAWLLLALLPVCNLFPSPRLGAERFLYLPLGGFCIWTAATLEAAGGAVSGTRRKILAAAVVAVVVALAAGTVARTRVWRNNLTLFEAAVRAAPDSSKARHGLGNEYFRRGRLREAVEEFHRAIAILPREPFYYNSLGVAYGEAGDLARAREQFEISRRLNPGDPLILINLAVLELKAGRPDRAERTIREYTQARPRDPHGFLILGEAALDGGNWETAREAYRSALDLDPGSADAWSGLAYCLYREGKPEEAQWAWRRALALDPGNPDVRRALESLRER
ncbi:MAG TPA: tetratricopeptide repeat protein, partial [bacterium]|nr:tetratricopeptide repeat protein [bacterium]